MVRSSARRAIEDGKAARQQGEKSFRIAVIVDDEVTK
jgi:hypothetical protein